MGIAAVKERTRINTAVSHSTPLFCPEMLFPRLGEHLIREGLITTRELNEALTQQKQRAAKGESILLGNLLVEKGLIDRKQLDTAVTKQVIKLKAALEQSNSRLRSRVAEHVAKLEETMVQLNQLDAMKSNFVANVSHELRTPLAVLVGHLDLWSRESMGELSADQRESIQSMTNATRRLWDLIEDLLQFSSAASGDMTLSLERFPIKQSVNSAVSQKKPQATDRQVLLNTKIMADLPQVYADQEKITWVVGQLLDNAIKFTPPKGKVMAYVCQKADKVQINVVDSGIGIPAGRIKEMFQSFHQLEESATRHYEGMGLGLAMAQKILSAHGSRIQVRSRVGVGSRFAFSLPYRH